MRPSRQKLFATRQAEIAWLTARIAVLTINSRPLPDGRNSHHEEISLLRSEALVLRGYPINC